MNTIKLNNGVEMPQMGYGVYQVSPAECERCVADALSAGYRMIDTAQAYHNEEGVGNAVRKSCIDRKEIFLVSKVWISNYGYEKAKVSINESLRKLPNGLHRSDVAASAFLRPLRGIPCTGGGVQRRETPCHRRFEFLPRPFH